MGCLVLCSVLGVVMFMGHSQGRVLLDEDAGFRAPPGFHAPPLTQAACGVPQVQGTRVVGGTEVKRGSWPWQIYVLKNGKMGGCGGTLINDRWVVTAAHCVQCEWWDRDCFKDKLGKRFSVWVGDHDFNAKECTKEETCEKKYAVEKMISHPEYSQGTLDNDITLFKLAKPVKMGKYVQPACMPSKELAPGTECYITGWGKTTGGGKGSRVLKQAKLNIVSNKECNAKNFQGEGSNIPITDGMICAGSGGTSINSGCQGDSGGPFVCKVNGKWELHGDVSHGPSDCDSALAYTVFARTLYFQDWIAKEMAKNQ